MEKRPSRQDFVVPPKGVSATSMIIGAVLCGLAGFAVVWLAGLGRGAQGRDDRVRLG